ncbi:MAG: galactokinase [Chloroflexi bacterium]|nr:galactokinase [Chloroflexota bacterium]MYH65281.1 galactokinase [Chloroflexota bacterium]
MTIKEKLQARFQTEFGAEPAFIARAPGRVNLIGEHTDYNDGFVLPLAIDRAAWIALRPRVDSRVRVISLDMADEQVFDLADLPRPDAVRWIDYIIGVAWALRRGGYAPAGWEGVLAGDVPIGSGLSSSAALELAAARAFYCVSDFDWDATRMAQIGRAAENEWLGIQTGIMDQMISAAGVAGRALLIDCRSLECSPAPLPAETSVVILDTATRRGLVGSAYNERRAQCEAATRHFGIAALRDIDLATFAERATELEPLIRRRARHVISENERTLQAQDAMLADDAEALGRLMIASHTSLRDDFEVSSPALDAIVDCANADPGCYGARMTGAGFGGCAVALARAEAAADFARRVGAAYEAATGNKPVLYATHASAGASTIG